MAGPWADYAPQQDSAAAGPWSDYGGAAPKAQAPPAPAAPERGDNAFMSLINGIAEPIAKAGSGLIAGPVSNIAGYGAAMRGSMAPPSSPEGAPGYPQRVQQQVQQALTYAPRTAAGQSDLNPLNMLMTLLGSAVHGAGNVTADHIAPPGTAADSPRGMAANAAREGVEQAPGLIGLKAPAAAGAAAPAVKGLAQDMMQSALKPPIAAQRTGKAAKAVDTLLDEGINVTGGGVDQLRSRIDGLNQQIADTIQNSTAVVDKEAVVSRLQKKLEQFGKQVNPNADLAAIQKSWTEFLNHPDLPGIDIPVQKAQEMKQGTYKALGDKSYGELKSADTEAQKALARGLKEEIANVVPEVKPLNAEDSKLLNALSLTERRVMMEANKNPIGLGWLSLSPSHLMGWMADRSGLFKSLIARMLNQTSESLPTAAKAGPAFGLAVGNAAQTAPQGPPPQ